jgi:radical SAM protein with 4Fe4S-binding SPASM domain
MSKRVNYPRDYTYNSRVPLYTNINNLSERQQDLLTRDPYFCIYPWIHLHAFPDGRAYACCMSKYDRPAGNLNQQSMQEVWNSDGIKKMRKNMLEGKPSEECSRCYEQENSGFTSLRHSSSQNFGHHIPIVDATKEDGTFDDFKIRYYDIRFSNVCNLRCRSCGSVFSSNWYNDEVKIRGPLHHPRIMYAGRNEEDMWEQMQEHIPHLEAIYFAGGEPLIMEEHYRLLNELVRREMFHVRLIYNTNFTKLSYKDQNVLELWKLFNSVSIGASLDASYERGEYMRKGTEWSDIVENRKQLQKECPQVDFYISATVSIFNALHIADFHREWVDLGLIRAQDININILQSPDWYRLDLLPEELRVQVREKVTAHLAWLEPQDKLTRATAGFKGMLTFMDAQPSNETQLKEFFKMTAKLDDIREEDLYKAFPELEPLRKYNVAK